MGDLEHIKNSIPSGDSKKKTCKIKMKEVWHHVLTKLIGIVYIG